MSIERWEFLRFLRPMARGAALLGVLTGGSACPGDAERDADEAMEELRDEAMDAQEEVEDELDDIEDEIDDRN